MSLRVPSVESLPTPELRDQARALLGLGAAKAELRIERRKYGNEPYEADGMRFDSRLEWRCYNWLMARVAAGEVLWFIRQAPFVLEGGVVYRCDFLAALASGPPYVEVIDATGMPTRAKLNKLKQVKARYDVEVKLWPPR